MSRKETCRHHDATTWRDKAAAQRPGWIRTTCRHCGGFIGYRPSDAKA